MHIFMIAMFNLVAVSCSQLQSVAVTARMFIIHFSDQELIV